MTDLQRWVFIIGFVLPMWLLWVKAGQCFVELVRIRHELEDAAKARKTKMVIG